MAFKIAATLDEVWDGEMMKISLNGQKIVLIHMDNCIQAFEDRCPHQSLPISQGILENGVFTCAAHHWEYDAVTGCGINPKNTCLKAYATQICDGQILVDPEQIVKNETLHMLQEK